MQDHLVIEQCFLGILLKHFSGYLLTAYIITANKFKPSTSDVNLDLPDFTQESRDNLHNPNVSR